MTDPRKIDIVGRWVAIALIVGFVGLLSNQAIRPLLSSHRDLVAFKEAVAILASADNSIERLNTQIELMQQKVAESEAQLPQDLDLDAFLEQLGELARETGVHIEKFTPYEVADQRLCRELPLDVRLAGSFPAIYNFLNHLEQGDRLSRIERLSVARGDAQNGCRARMELVLFFAKEQSG